MSNKTISLKRTVLTQALALAFAAGMSSVAFAQSNTTGTIHGTVEAQAGTTVVVDGEGTGYHRSITPDANGNFQALSLPVGEYKVSLVKNGKVERTEEVSVTIGSAREVSFMPARVEVTGRANRIDVQSTNNGATFTARELEKIPVANNVAAVIQLAPSTVKGDPRYGGAGAPSFGGASASENAYYINGFPVTNALTQVGFSSLPFGAISQASILEGGYGAEFGRSTGGVVNLTTKRGTNQWEVGGAIQYAPKSLRSNPKNLIYPGTSTVRRWDQDDTVDAWTVSAELGGPIIKDKLFFYANIEQQRQKIEGTRVVNTDPTAGAVGWEKRTLDLPKSLIKLDWNITDDHHLEYTMSRDRPKDERTYYGFDYATNTHNNVVGGGVLYKNYGPTPIAAVNGGDLDVLKYTGSLTDALTLTVLTGRTKTERVQKFTGYNPAAPLITVTSPFPGFTYDSGQPYTANQLVAGAFSKTEGTRVDLEWNVNDKHTVRVGFDNNKLTALSGDATPGGIEYRYDSLPCLSNGVSSQLPGPGSPNVPTNLQSGGECFYVYSHYFDAISKAETDQAAQYIEDRWQVTPKLLLALGLRNEQFKNKNGNGDVFVEQKRQIEPRVGVTYDLNGDGGTKLFGNAGRYHLQLPTNVAIRGAGSSTFLDQYFSYTGVQAGTGLPTGTVALTPRYSPDGELGQPKDTSYIAAKDLDAHFQDEIAFGFEKAFSKSLNFGAKFTYRTLKSTIEDFCDDRPFVTWANEHGKSSDYFESKWSCSSFNPGKTNTWDLDIDGDGTKEHIVLTPQDMANRIGSFPKSKREYTALDFFAEHPFDGKWYGKINYTWSKSKGNTEGQLNSDFGQADPGATLTDDHYELTVGANGLLPNNRTHVIKAFGFYSLTPEWGFGGNVFIASGRPKNCIGSYPTIDPATGQPNILGAQDYGNAYFFCKSAPSPRGSAGELPWQSSVDLNVTFKPQPLPGVSFKIDVFNVFNTQDPEQQRDSSSPASRYQLVEAWSAPRSMKFTAQYNKKF
jgi:hypothetical protein